MIVKMLLLSEKEKMYVVMTIYEANSRLIEVGNAMIEEHGLKYYIVPRTILDESNIELYKQPYDDVESAYNAAILLPKNWSIE